ncbi:AraC family transcriptional regulator [[Clostridium] cellulosi]
MIYQETLQSGENPAEINVSGCVYANGIREEASGFPNHCHSFFEIEYLFEGSGIYQINSEKIETPNNCLLVKPPLCVHGSYGNGQSKNLVVQFGYNFLNKNAFTLKKNSLLFPTNKLEHNCILIVEKNSELERLLLEIVKIVPVFVTPLEDENRKIEYSPEYEWKLNSLTLSLLVYLLENKYLAIVEDGCDFTDVLQLQNVLNRIVKNPEEKLSMKDAAKMAGMSYAYFSRTFKKTIGQSFVDFCNAIKIHRAEELLKSQKFSVTDIANSLGFGSVSYFNRIFKQYNGSTPTQYKNKIN